MKIKQISVQILLLFMSILLMSDPSLSADRVKLEGSGASFPFPLYGQWFKAYGKVHRNIKVDYQAKGSGAGIQDFINHTVDFGASDAAMKDAEIAQVERGVQLAPVVAGSIVLAYNIEELGGELKLPRDVYTDIFLGNITTWHNLRIQDANPDLNLPRQTIAIVVRHDGASARRLPGFSSNKGNDTRRCP